IERTPTKSDRWTFVDLAHRWRSRNPGHVGQHRPCHVTVPLASSRSGRHRSELERSSMCLVTTGPSREGWEELAEADWSRLPAWMRDKTPWQLCGLGGSIVWAEAVEWPT